MTSRKHRHKDRDTLHSSMTSRKHRHKGRESTPVRLQENTDTKRETHFTPVWLQENTHKETDTPLQSGFKKTDTKREKHLTPVWLQENKDIKRDTHSTRTQRKRVRYCDSGVKWETLRVHNGNFSFKINTSIIFSSLIYNIKTNCSESVKND